MKKLFVLILAIALMATMSVTVFAEENETSTITVVMKDSGGDGWGGDAFGFVSLSTDELEFEDYSGHVFPKGVTNLFTFESGTTDTITHTVAKNEVVYFRWIDPENKSDEEASFNIYRDGILQYSCDDVTKFNGSDTVYELFFTSYSNQREMTVSYNVEPTYTVTIPTDVAIDGNNATTISAENVVVEKGKYVSVSLAADNNFTVATAEGAELTYTITANGENVAAGDEILAVNPTDSKNGTATITFDIDETAIQYAGTYTGSAIFTVAVKDAPVTIINFTIDDEPYQAEEGMTWEQWMETEYNTKGFHAAYGGVYWDGCIVCDSTVTYPWEGSVAATDVIQAGEAYQLLEDVS